MFGFGFALIVIVLWLRFGLGCLHLRIPYDVLKISKGGIVSARLLSAGFLASPLAFLASPFLNVFGAPFLIGGLFCAPGLIAIHRLRSRLEIRGNQAKPVMAWLDRGVVAGWTALCSAVVWWLFTTLLLLLPTP
jgi:hypothetical protein